MSSNFAPESVNTRNCSYNFDSFTDLKRFLELCPTVDNAVRDQLIKVFQEEYVQLLKDKQFALPILITTLIGFSLMIFFGSMGSGLVIYVILRRPAMRTRSNLFIMNLAISDVTLCLITQPFSLYRLLIGGNPWILGEFMCKFSAMFQGTNIFVSTISITAIAIDRFQCIVHPATARQKSGQFDIRLIALTWFIALVLAFPLTFFSRLVQQDVYQCTEKAEDISTQKWKMIYSLAALLFQYVLPLCIVSIVYSQVCLKIRKRLTRERPHNIFVVREETSVNQSFSETNRSFEQTKRITDCKRFVTVPSTLDLPTTTDKGDEYTASVRCLAEQVPPSCVRKSSMSQTRPIILLTSIAIVFGLSWLPLNIVNVWMDARELSNSMSLMPLTRAESSSSNHQLQNSTNRAKGPTVLLDALKRSGTELIGDTIIALQTVCLLLVLTSACMNPILYGWLNRNFRKEFRNVLKLLSFSRCSPKKKEENCRILMENRTTYKDAIEQAYPVYAKSCGLILEDEHHTDFSNEQRELFTMNNERKDDDDPQSSISISLGKLSGHNNGSFKQRLTEKGQIGRIPDQQERSNSQCSHDH